MSLFVLVPNGMAKDKTYLHPITVELSESTLAAVAPEGGAERTRKLSNLAGYFLKEYAEGGMLLTQAHLSDIERATDTTVASPKDVVAAVAKGLGRDEGQFVLKAAVDPAYVEPLREIATFQGCTLDELLTNCINLALTNGWLYEFNARDGMMIPVEGEDWDTMCAFMGKGAFTGKEIVAKIRATMTQKQED